MNDLRQSAIVPVIACLLTGCADKTVVSEGDRVGVVTKLSHKHLCYGNSDPWSWEGELATQAGTVAAGQGVTDGGQSPVGVWQFSVDPQSPDRTEQTVSALREAMNNGHTVRISYRQVRSHAECETGTDYYVTLVVDLSGNHPEERNK